jgi:hypothetical protein
MIKDETRKKKVNSRPGIPHIKKSNKNHEVKGPKPNVK